MNMTNMGSGILQDSLGNVAMGSLFKDVIRDGTLTMKRSLLSENLRR